MKNLKTIVSTLLCLGAMGCSAQEDSGQSAMLDAGPKAEITELTAEEIPAAVASAAQAKVDGLLIEGAQRKERDGMIFFDVEGKRPDGAEVELDILEEESGYLVVEVQRDIAWTEAPTPVLELAAGNSDFFTPERVIESVQEDDTVIYELFESGKPDEPAAEISFKDGEAAFLEERWKY